MSAASMEKHGGAAGSGQSREPRPHHPHPCPRLPHACREERVNERRVAPLTALGATPGGHAAGDDEASGACQHHAARRSAAAETAFCG